MSWVGAFAATLGGAARVPGPSIYLVEVHQGGNPATSPNSRANSVVIQTRGSAHVVMNFL